MGAGGGAARWPACSIFFWLSLASFFSFAVFWQSEHMVGLPAAFIFSNQSLATLWGFLQLPQTSSTGSLI
ncbi:hypothetical protein D3C81_1886270 [compost metagenome]|jgi:hypothetical protein